MTVSHDDLAHTTRMAQHCADTDRRAKVVMVDRAGSHYWFEAGEAAFKSGDTFVCRLEPRTQPPKEVPAMRPHDDPAFRERVGVQSVHSVRLPCPYPVVFLDCDGVIAPHEAEYDQVCLSGKISREHVLRLNRILHATDARVVLSSAWRYLIFNGDMVLSGFDWLLRSHGFMHSRLTGVTPPDTMVRGNYNGVPSSWPQEAERGTQITRWREGIGHAAKYVVLDDLDLGITAAGHQLILCDGRVGLTDADVERAIGILLGRVE